MKVVTYLVLEGLRNRYNGTVNAVRVVNARAKKPALGTKQIAIRLEIEVPQGVFEYAVPVAKIQLEQRQIIQPEVIALEAPSPKPDTMTPPEEK